MTEMQLLEFLKQNHTGETKAVSSRELEADFEIKGSLVRKLVNSLRCGGYPVCSDQNGYYYAASSSELQITIRQLSSRISKIAGAKNGLLRARARWPDNGQTTLPI
jgi:biotin operon repressor